MSIRIRAAVTSVAALAAVTSVGLIAPAAMADPKLPDGCTFDRTTGTTTCTSSSASTTRTEPMSALGLTSDGSLAALYCSPSGAPLYVLDKAVFGATTTTTTTSTYHGARGNGNKPVASHDSTNTTYQLVSGDAKCVFGRG